jgi:hypothetical protein
MARCVGRRGGRGVWRRPGKRERGTDECAQVFVLIDKVYHPVSRMSSPEGVDRRDVSVRYALLTCGHLRGILAAFGVEATVDYDVSHLPIARFSVTLQRKVSIAESTLVAGKPADAAPSRADSAPSRADSAPGVDDE